MCKDTISHSWIDFPKDGSVGLLKHYVVCLDGPRGRFPAQPMEEALSGTTNALEKCLVSLVEQKMMKRTFKKINGRIFSLTLWKW